MGQAVGMTSAADPTPSASIAFICAMPMELEPLRAKLDLRASTVGGVTVQSGTLGDRRVVAIVTGMGPDLATAGTTRLLDAVTVERVVVVGITGAVENDTPIGTLILPEVVVNGATGAEYRPAPLGGGVHAGTMWTTDTLITDQGDIARLRDRGVVSLDMETAAIAEMCEQRAIPWSVFRVISDRASDGSIDEEVFHLSNMDGSPNNEAIERCFAEHPERLEAMTGLAEGALLATDAAAEAAIRACTTG
jgi:adenosylhomocysteine nucleosidase